MGDFMSIMIFSSTPPKYSLSFNGTDEVVTFIDTKGSVDGTYEFINDTDIFTTHCWVKLTDYTATGSKAFFGNSIAGSWTGFSLGWYNIGGVGRITFNIYRQGVSFIRLCSTVDNVIADNEWHKISVVSTAHSVGSCTIKIDDVIQPLLTDLVNTIGGGANFDFQIGAGGDGNGKCGCQVDKLSIFNTALSDSDLAILGAIGRDRNDYSTLSCYSSLVSLFECDEVNTIDSKTGNIGTPTLMDSNNIIQEEGDLVDNQGLVVSSQDWYRTDFNGTDERIDCGYSSTLQPLKTDSFSGGACIRMTTTGTERTIFTNRGSGGPVKGIRFYIDTARRIIVDIIASGTNAIRCRTTSTISLNTDYFIHFTYDGSVTADGVLIYIDNVSQPFTKIYDGLTGLIQPTGQSFGISNNSRGGSVYWVGQMNNVHFANPKLSDAQYTTMYEKGGFNNVDYSEFLPNIVSHWKLTDINPIDEIGNNNGTSILMDLNNLTLDGNSDIPNNQGFIVRPAIIYTSYNGTDEKTIFGSDVSINFALGDTFTVSIWVQVLSTPGDSRYIAGKIDASGEGWFFERQNDGRMAFRMQDFTANRYGRSVSTTLTGSWVNLIGSWDGLNTGSSVDFRVNGAYQNLNANTGTMTSISSGSEPLSIGKVGHKGSYIEQNVSNFAIWNRVLTSVEKTSVFDKGRINPDYSDIPNLVFHSKLDTLNPSDETGTSNGTSNFQDINNIITE